eukprot:scaffold334_cov241-Pinguiococcus_pyrenoidosus.AAC.46
MLLNCGPIASCLAGSSLSAPHRQASKPGSTTRIGSAAAAPTVTPERCTEKTYTYPSRHPSASVSWPSSPLPTSSTPPTAIACEDELLVGMRVGRMPLHEAHASVLPPRRHAPARFELDQLHDHLHDRRPLRRALPSDPRRLHPRVGLEPQDRRGPFDASVPVELEEVPAGGAEDDRRFLHRLALLRLGDPAAAGAENHSVLAPRDGRAGDVQALPSRLVSSAAGAHAQRQSRRLRVAIRRRVDTASPLVVLRQVVDGQHAPGAQEAQSRAALMPEKPLDGHQGLFILGLRHLFRLGRYAAPQQADVAASDAPDLQNGARAGGPQRVSMRTRAECHRAAPARRASVRQRRVPDARRSVQKHLSEGGRLEGPEAP